LGVKNANIGRLLCLIFDFVNFRFSKEKYFFAKKNKEKIVCIKIMRIFAPQNIKEIFKRNRVKK